MPHQAVTEPGFKPEPRIPDSRPPMQPEAGPAWQTIPDYSMKERRPTPANHSTTGSPYPVLQLRAKSTKWFLLGVSKVLHIRLELKKKERKLVFRRKAQKQFLLSLTLLNLADKIH